MKRAPGTLLAASVALATSGLLSMPAGAAADDQDRLDAAMEAFNERMTEAGWESQGQPDTAADDDLEADEDLLAGDEAFAECLGDLAAVFEGEAADSLPGQTAEAFSDEFQFVGEEEAPEPTEAPTGTDDLDFDFDFDLDFEEEELAAQAMSVDEADVGTLEELVDAFASEQTGECLTEAIAAEMEAGAEGDDLGLLGGFDIAIATDGDLGVGDQSARMQFDMSMSFFGMPLAIDASFVMARSGRDLVILTHSVIGEPQSDLDALAELEAIVDSL